MVIPIIKSVIQFTEAILALARAGVRQLLAIRHSEQRVTVAAGIPRALVTIVSEVTAKAIPGVVLVTFVISFCNDGELKTVDPCLRNLPCARFLK